MALVFDDLILDPTREIILVDGRLIVGNIGRTYLIETDINGFPATINRLDDSAAGLVASSNYLVQGFQTLSVYEISTKGDFVLKYHLSQQQVEQIVCDLVIQNRSELPRDMKLDELKEGESCYLTAQNLPVQFTIADIASQDNLIFIAQKGGGLLKFMIDPGT